MATTAVMHSTLASFLAVLVVAVMTIGQPTPPTEGYQMGSPLDYDLIMPLSVAQCEPVLMYYNITNVFYSEPPTLFFFSASLGTAVTFVTFGFLNPIGYLEWICNIPAGAEFVAAFGMANLYTVQPGSSSACLGNVTTTYSDMDGVPD
jgi:hypothetical protein